MKQRAVFTRTDAFRPLRPLFQGASQVSGVHEMYLPDALRIMPRQPIDLRTPPLFFLARGGARVWEISPGSAIDTGIDL